MTVLHKNLHSSIWDFPCEEFHDEQWKEGNRRLSVYRTNCKRIKISFVFFEGNMGLDKYCLNVLEYLRKIIEGYGEDFIFYMDNNPKHTSKKSLEWY